MHLRQFPTGQVVLNKRGEVAMPHVAADVPGLFPVGRINDDVSLGAAKQVADVAFVDVVFNQVVDDVHREAEVGVE